MFCPGRRSFLWRQASVSFFFGWRNVDSSLRFFNPRVFTPEDLWFAVAKFQVANLEVFFLESGDVAISRIRLNPRGGVWSIER